MVGTPEQGLEVVFLENNIRGFIKKSENCNGKSKQRPSLFSKDNKVQAKNNPNQSRKQIHISFNQGKGN